MSSAGRQQAHRAAREAALEAPSRRFSGAASAPASASVGAHTRPLEGAAPLGAAAWLAWLIAASAAVFLTSNPLYLSTALLVALTVYASLPPNSKQRAYGLIIWVGVSFALLSIPFNLLTGSSGETGLFTLPSLSFPDWLGGVVLGGRVTAESFLFAAERALRLVALLLFAAAFTVGVDHYRLLRLVPSALKQMGVVVTVAVLLIPQTLQQAKSVAEAQRLRGRPIRGLKNLSALAVPVLAGALERSIQRAELLDARGFGSLDPAATSTGLRTAAPAVGGLGLASFGAFAFFYSGPSPASLAAVLTGVALVAVAVRMQGGRSHDSRYRPESITPVDRAVLGSALLSLVLFGGMRALGAGDVSYLPFPAVSMPAFHPAGVVATLLLLAPAVILLHRPNSQEEPNG